MKLKKRRIIGFVGASVLTVPALISIASCTFTRDKYTAPIIRYVGENSFDTNEGVDNVTIDGFTLDRNKLDGEVITVEPIGEAGEPLNDLPVTTTCNVDGKKLTVNVKFKSVEGFPQEASFKLKFNIAYKDKFDSQTLDNLFTVNYVPPYRGYTITYVGGSKKIETTKGVSEFSLQFQLDEKLAPKTVLEEPYVNDPDTNKVSVSSYEYDGNVNVTVNLSVAHPDQYTGVTQGFDLYFPITYYGKAKPALSDTGFEVTYIPEWRPISVGFLRTKTLEDPIVFDEVLDDADLTVTSQFYLNRKLEDGENLLVTIEGTDKDYIKIKTQEMGIVGKDGAQFVDMIFGITPRAANIEYETYMVSLVFTITKDGENPRQFKFENVSFAHRLSWLNNTVSDVDTTTNSWETEDGVTSFSIITPKFQLTRPEAIDETINVTVLNNENKEVVYKSYQTFVNNGETYLKLYFDLNINPKITSGPTFYFGLQFDICKSGTVKNTSILPSKGNYSVKYKYTPSDISIPSRKDNTVGGEKFYSITGQLSKALPADQQTITATSSNTRVKVSNISNYSPINLTIQIELEILFPEGYEEEFYMSDNYTTYLTFTLPEVGQLEPKQITLGYVGATEHPESGETISSYLHDRSISLVSYKKASSTSPSYTVTTSTAWLVGKARPLSDAKTADYAYYVVAPYNIFESIGNDYIDYLNGNINEFHIAVADGNMQRDYIPTGESKAVSGLYFETDYMELDPENAFYFETSWLDEGKMLWIDTEDWWGTYRGGSNLFVARINFAITPDADTKEEQEEGTCMNTHFKNKLSKLNQWKKDGNPFVNFKPSASTGTVTWNTSEILQGGFPTKTITIGTSPKSRDIDLAYWFEGRWYTEGGGAFSTKYVSASNSWNSSDYYYNEYLDSNYELMHYTPCYYVGNVIDDDRPKLSPGSLVAYRNYEEDPIKGTIEVFGIFGGFNKKGRVLFDVLQTDATTNILSAFINDTIPYHL